MVSLSYEIIGMVRGGMVRGLGGAGSSEAGGLFHPEFAIGRLYFHLYDLLSQSRRIRPSYQPK